MTHASGYGASGPERVARTAALTASISRITLIAIYSTTAIIGLPFTSPRALLMVAPMFAVIAAAVAGMALHLSGRAPNRDRLWSIAIAAAGLVPFGSGITVLGAGGAIFLLGMLVSGVTLLITQLSAGSPPAQARHGRSSAGQPRPAQPPAHRAAFAEDVFRERLRDASLDALFTHWRATGARLIRTDAPHGVSLARFRALLIEEMERRDPHGVERWLSVGDVDEPERYVRMREPGV